jgi:wyosine [tRNA(Phe)-imidazoG37] synthetase (radical SAM superfamily)
MIKKRVPAMSHIFGPVPSRRLGLSLGVDMIPPKTCTYDCLYCEVGKTTCNTIDAGPYVPLIELTNELELALGKTPCDTITLAGSGEPTLNSGIDNVISFIKERSDTNVALLTNGSLLWKEEILKKVLAADIILPTLSTAVEETFKTIHKPCHGLSLSMLIRGLKGLRKSYEGLIFLEVVLLSGINDTDLEIEGLRNVISEISPDRIQLNTIIRPPSDPKAMPVHPVRMEQIKDYLGSKAEIVVYIPSDRDSTGHDINDISIIEMARRRPVRLIDISGALNMSQEETGCLIKIMLRKGDISEKIYGGEIFYTA